MEAAINKEKEAAKPAEKEGDNNTDKDDTQPEGDDTNKDAELVVLADEKPAASEDDKNELYKDL